MEIKHMYWSNMFFGKKIKKITKTTTTTTTTTTTKLYMKHTYINDNQRKYIIALVNSEY